MLSQKAIDYLKENWYSFEQIEWIKKWLEESENWDILSKSEMKDFIKSNLFSKYKTECLK